MWLYVTKISAFKGKIGAYLLKKPLKVSQRGFWGLFLYRSWPLRKVFFKWLHVCSIFFRTFASVSLVWVPSLTAGDRFWSRRAPVWRCAGERLHRQSWRGSAKVSSFFMAKRTITNIHISRFTCILSWPRKVTGQYTDLCLFSFTVVLIFDDLWIYYNGTAATSPPPHRNKRLSKSVSETGQQLAETCGWMVLRTLTWWAELRLNK